MEGLASPRSITLASSGQYSHARIRVGPGYQATKIPALSKPPASNGHASDARVGKPVWRPTRLKVATVDSFLAKARELVAPTGTPDDATLAHLHSCSYNTKPALHQLRQDHARALPPDLAALNLMATDDISSFEKAVGQVGKNFHDIHVRMERAVPVSTLVLFYFARWKGTEAFERWKSAWNQRINNDSCYVCGETSCSVENFLLCCDGCPLAYHNLCCDPPVAKDDVPDDSWYCQHCQSAKKGKAKGKVAAVTRPLATWKENSKLEARHEGTGKWFAATIVMASKKRIKISYEGWDRKWNEWIKKTASHRIAPLGTHLDKDAKVDVPEFAVAQAFTSSKLKTRNLSRKPTTMKVRIEHLEDDEAAYARRWVKSAKNILQHRKGEAYVSIILPAAGTAMASDSSGEEESSADAARAADADADAESMHVDAARANKTGAAPEAVGSSPGPTISEVRDLLAKVKSIPAHIDTEAELVTLEDAADEWLARAAQTCIPRASAAQNRGKPHYEAVVALVEAADDLCLDLDGDAEIRAAVAVCDEWEKRVRRAVQQDFCAEDTIRELQRSGAALSIQMVSCEELLDKLADKLEAQRLDEKIQEAFQAPTPAAQLQDLYDSAKKVSSDSSTFHQLGRVVERINGWLARTHEALTGNSCSIPGMKALVEQATVMRGERVLVDGVQDLEQSIVAAEKWVDAAENMDWENPDMADFRALQKTSVQLGVKAKIPALDKVRDVVERANGWLNDFRRLVPKRVNKKELHKLSTVDDLRHLLSKADSLGVHMDEAQQLKDVIQSSEAVLAKIQAALAEAVDDGGPDGRDDYINSLRSLLKEGEQTPIKMPALSALRERIREIEYQETWERKVEEAMERGNLSETKLQSLLQEGGCDFSCAACAGSLPADPRSLQEANW